MYIDLNPIGNMSTQVSTPPVLSIRQQMGNSRWSSDESDDITLNSLCVKQLLCVRSMCTQPTQTQTHTYILRPLEGDPYAFTHPLPHTPEIPPPPHECVLPARPCVCVCVSEETLSPISAKRTHFLCQIASRIPHSPSIRLAQAIFSSFLLRLPFLGSLWGALSAGGRTKHRFIPGVKHDPRQHNAFRRAHTHTQTVTFQGVRAGENKFLAAVSHYF